MIIMLVHYHFKGVFLGLLLSKIGPVVAPNVMWTSPKGETMETEEDGKAQCSTRTLLTAGGVGGGGGGSHHRPSV